MKSIKAKLIGHFRFNIHDNVNELKESVPTWVSWLLVTEATRVTHTCIHTYKYKHNELCYCEVHIRDFQVRIINYYMDFENSHLNLRSEH